MLSLSVTIFYCHVPCVSTQSTTRVQVTELQETGATRGVGVSARHTNLPSMKPSDSVLETNWFALEVVSKGFNLFYKLLIRKKYKLSDSMNY